MRYIRTENEIYDGSLYFREYTGWYFHEKSKVYAFEEIDIIKEADTIEELCDCFVKIKRNKGCKDYILKFDHKDLSVLRQQRVRYPTSPVYGAIHIEDEGLKYVAKMNEKGELELL